MTIVCINIWIKWRKSLKNVFILQILLAVGLSIVIGDLLRQIPIAVLFGIFLYMGVMSLNGIQLTERILLLLMPPKYHPDHTYVRKVRTPFCFLFIYVTVTQCINGIRHCTEILWLILYILTESLFLRWGRCVCICSQRYRWSVWLSSGRSCPLWRRWLSRSFSSWPSLSRCFFCHASLALVKCSV